MKFGVGFRPDEQMTTLLDYFSLADELGFDSAWVRDVYYERNAWTCLTAAAMRTRNIRLGTSVTEPFRTHPSVTATIAATLDELSNGRVNLGFGAGAEYIEAIFGIPMDKAFTACKEAITIMRQLWKGDEVHFQGKVFKVEGAKLGLSREGIPIYLGARGPKMHLLAGQVADGAILHGVSPKYLRIATGRIKEGAAAAGRKIDNFDVVVLNPVVITDNKESLLEEIRPWIASQVAAVTEETAEWYDQTWEDVKPLREAYFDHQFSKAFGMVTQQMIDTFSIFGSEEECLQRLEEARKAGLTHVASTVLPDIRKSIERLARLAKRYNS